MKALVTFAALAAAFAPVVARAQVCDLTLVAQDESGHRNIPNYRYDARHTAGGHWQITDSNWRRFAPMVDIDIQKWPNALSAPEQLQGQVAGMMRAKLGCLPWAPFNSRLRAVLSVSKGRDIGLRQAGYAVPAPVRNGVPSLAVKTLSQRPAWSSAQVARLTASSDVYNPMNIAFGN